MLDDSLSIAFIPIPPASCSVCGWWWVLLYILLVLSLYCLIDWHFMTTGVQRPFHYTPCTACWILVTTSIVILTYLDETLMVPRSTSTAEAWNNHINEFTISWSSTGAIVKVNISCPYSGVHLFREITHWSGWSSLLFLLIASTVLSSVFPNAFLRSIIPFPNHWDHRCIPLSC